VKFFLYLIFLSVSFSCSSPELKIHEGKHTYSLSDVSGSFRLERDVKFQKNRLITRNRLINPTGGNSKILEKSITLSQFGSVKTKKGSTRVVRPLASEFFTWLEGKKHESRMRVDLKTRTMVVTSSDKKEQIIPFPKGQHFCFFSQIPDCLNLSGILKRASERTKQAVGFMVIWDSFPFTPDLYLGAGKNLFSSANFKYDGRIKNRIRYILEVDGQVILYHFSRDHKFEKMAWISQGLTIVPPGEEESGIDNQ
jgi:hypothetical protein